MMRWRCLPLRFLCWVLFRFYEKKYNILTYFVIAAGINLSLLSKLTTGMIVCIIALGIVLFTFFKEKRLSPLLIGDSLLRSPCMEYLLSTSGRFIKDSIQFNRITKLSPNKNLCRVECIAILILVDRWGVWEYLCYFFQKFMGTWDTLAGHTYLPRENSTLSSHLGLSSIALTAILVMPFILFLVSASKEVWYLRISVMSIVITFTYQMLNSGIHELQC